LLGACENIERSASSVRLMVVVVGERFFTTAQFFHTIAVRQS